VILYLHGGVCPGRGYVLLATEDHFSMLASLQKDYNVAVAIALLNYSLAPKYPFPTQRCPGPGWIKSTFNITIIADDSGG